MAHPLPPTDGAWQPGFTPATDVGFAQGSSATYTWMVPQDVSGLAVLMGGRDAAADRLDTLFHDELEVNLLRSHAGEALAGLLPAKAVRP